MSLFRVKIFSLIFFFILILNSVYSQNVQNIDVGAQFSELFNRYPIPAIILILASFVIGYLLGKSSGSKRGPKRVEHY
jgi:uncharacterized integral membrane protein